MNQSNLSLALPPGQFVDQVCAKDLIVLHHTVGGSARSTRDYWAADPERIGTAFIVERDGTVYQAFDPTRWAHHLGIKAPNNPGFIHDRRSIGIEIASEGALQRHLDGTLWAFDGKRQVQAAGAFDLGHAWRGVRYFDAYDQAQLAAVIQLVGGLLDRFPNIPRRTLARHDLTPDEMAVALPGHYSFEGVCAHADLRADKTDVHPGFPWDELARACRLEVLP